MKNLRKTIIRILLTFIILTPIAAFAHFIVFPQETRSILIDYSNFKKEGRVYFASSINRFKIDSLQSLIRQASIRIDSFWGQQTSEPKFLYCDTRKDFVKYSVSTSAPAVTYLKLGSVTVLSNDGIDLDIIAHEISHAELYERIGFYAFNFSIPSWFKHGLAMQNDYRDYYSEDTLKARSNNLRTIPDIQNLTTDKEFYAGSNEQVMLKYMTAKHEVKNWYSKKKLHKLIQDLNSGKSFETAYEQ